MPALPQGVFRFWRACLFALIAADCPSVYVFIVMLSLFFFFLV